MKYQRGITEILLIAIIAGGLVAVGFAALTVYNHAIARAENAEARAIESDKVATAQLTENARLKGAAEAMESVRKDRAGYNINRADIERMVSNAVQSVYAKSPEARKWAATPVPADVLAVVRNADGGPSDNQKLSGKITRSGDNTNTGASMAGTNDKRGVTGPNPLAPNSVTKLQSGQGGPPKVAGPPSK